MFGQLPWTPMLKLLSRIRTEWDHKLGEEPRKKEKSKKGKDFSVAKQFTILELPVPCISEIREMK